jgi:hypothetical protein
MTPERGAGEWQPIRPRVTVSAQARTQAEKATDRMNALLGVASGTPRARGGDHVIVADAATCASYLLRYLSHHGFIERRVEESASAETESPRTAEQSEAASRVAAARSEELGGPLARWPRPVDRTARGGLRRPRRSSA